MLNLIWLFMILLSIIFGIINGKIDNVVSAVTNEAKHAFEMALLLGGVLSFWLGIMKIAEESGLIKKVSVLLKPILKRLFSDVPVDHPAMGAIVMNILLTCWVWRSCYPIWFVMEALDRLNPYRSINQCHVTSDKYLKCSACTSLCHWFYCCS